MLEIGAEQKFIPIFDKPEDNTFKEYDICLLYKFSQ
jgi:hypothetical protein